MQQEFPLEEGKNTLSDKIKFFYENNKILIISSFFILIIITLSITYYFYSKDKQKILNAEKYVSAKIDLNNNLNIKAMNALVQIIESNDKTYSPLSLFLIIDANLIKDDQKIVSYFDIILKNNKFEKEIENLIIFKKALIQSSFVDELELLKTLNVLINSENLWKSHALLLLGDYFYSKGEFVKAKENYLKILALNNPDQLHDYARNRLQQSTNEK